jgi:CheY-like chemotaxis protein
VVSPKRILVVDDEEAVCSTIDEFLRRDGHEVETTCVPGDAVEFCRKRYFDLIFLDYHLPETTGDQVVSQLRQINPRQRIVLMSGHRPYPPLGEADFFIRKPFAADILRDAVERFASTG